MFPQPAVTGVAAGRVRLQRPTATICPAPVSPRRSPPWPTTTGCRVAGLRPIRPRATAPPGRMKLLISNSIVLHG
ncbi:cationic amino acid transporter 3, mitochondrial-like [Iris pallida]|uniref:Cationic amino acid transporter 3, mitochondrial-like n=1 Tax=Iris pallida TaxID=29817 RepID=A0AAX6FZ73_IRIPA|nr:cationic amino acid transporter 3, mitochondrial-like [Iris pallida]